MNRKPEKLHPSIQKHISQLCDEDLVLSIKHHEDAIADQKAFIDALKFELGARQVKAQCQSDDPHEMCIRCDCWKSARAACT